MNRHPFPLFCYLFIFSLFYKQAYAEDPVCRTSNGHEGVCVSYEKCQFVLDLYSKYGTHVPKYFRDHIYNSRCFPDSGETTIHLCCRRSKTQENFPARDGRKLQPAQHEINNNTKMNPEGVRILRALRCGHPNNNRISGGIITHLNEFPWMALLSYSGFGNEFKCAGTLITQKFILTAAHCVNQATMPVMGVRLGEYDINKDVDCQKFGMQQVCSPPVRDVGIDRIFIHPEHNVRKRINDIALIRLQENIRFDVHISPICLPVTEQSQTWEAADDFIISGWGKTETGATSSVLLKAPIRLKDSSVCRDSFRVPVDASRHICAGDVEKGRDSCKGDSGGPMFQLSPYIFGKRYVQYGIVSFGGVQCDLKQKLPGFYTNVITYMPWITKIIAEY